MLLDDDAQNVTDREEAEESIPFGDQERSDAVLEQPLGRLQQRRLWTDDHRLHRHRFGDFEGAQSLADFLLSRKQRIDRSQ